jgi:hypothetical protein
MKHDDPLHQALREVGSVEPSDALVSRLLRALVDAERREQAAAQEKRRRRNTWLSHFRLSLPALASVAIAAHLVLVVPTTEEAMPEALFAEHRVELPEQGHAALPLLLSLAEHDSEFASVRLDVPHGVEISPSDQAISASEPSCHRAGCVYEFVHPTSTEHPHLEVRVQKPGRYLVGVEHASTTKRLREIIVVHASR